ncbi:NAD(+)/NADH kinase [bacterium]|nr:NAD(+)/NADH kinase [bacterium]MCK5599998.1 NAD(+)/NADH kinase [bacterium]
MIGIYINPEKIEFKKQLEDLFVKMDENKLRFTLNTGMRKYFKDEFSYEDPATLVSGKDVVIVVGGDGTFLKLIQDTGALGGKYVLVNIGYVGFLSSFTLGEFLADLKNILDRKNSFIRLPILSIAGADGQQFAINDIVFENDGKTRLLRLELHVDGSFYHSLRASGLVLSTATGSSAICYSSGGPIVEVGLDLIVYKAISPQFNCEPSVVFNGDHAFEVVNRNDFPIIYTIDGIRTSSMKPGDRINVGLMKDATCNLVLFKDKNINDILREKLFNKE